jgi:dGTPase
MALAHDLGHTPFGHAGEDALNEELQPYGGFDHNIQCLRIVTLLERCYAEFDGLNLTWEALEGIAKHNGPLSGPQAAGESDASRPSAAGIAAVVGMDLELDTWPSLEAQIAALSDDIAYNNHDIDDGLRAGLFSITDLDAVPLVGPAFHEVAERYGDIERPRLIHEAVRRLIDRMVNDLLEETRRRLAAAKPESADAVRGHDGPLVSFSESMRQHDRELKAFLFQRMYRHHRVNRMASKARRVVRELFRLFLAEPEILPSQWRRQTDGEGTPRTARTVADYLAGMTDRYALDEYARLFDVDTKA